MIKANIFKKKKNRLRYYVVPNEEAVESSHFASHEHAVKIFKPKQMYSEQLDIRC